MKEDSWPKVWELLPTRNKPSKPKELSGEEGTEFT